MAMKGIHTLIVLNTENYLWVRGFFFFIIIGSGCANLIQEYQQRNGKSITNCLKILEYLNLVNILIKSCLCKERHA